MLTRLDPQTTQSTEPDDRPVAIIIGAGFGGLAAGVRLGVKGYRVVILDRLDMPGGRASSISQDGYRFDLGPTIVTVPQVFEALWTLAGRDMARDIDLRPLDPFYTIRFPDGSTFTARQDAEAMRAEVARLSPADLARYDRFMADSEVRYRFGFENLGRRPMHKAWETIKVLPIFAWLRADRSTYGHAAACMKDERLRMALSFHPLFIGGDPFNVTSMYSLVAYLEKTFGVHYAMGGAGALAEGIAGLVRRTGGELRFGVSVDEITVRDYQISQSQTIILMIDLGRMMLSRSSDEQGQDAGNLLDLAIDASLMLAYVALAQGDRVGLIAYADTVVRSLPAKAGAAQLNRLIHAVHDLHPRPVESRHDQAFLALRRLERKRSLAVLCTHVLDDVNADSLVHHLARLHGRHLPLAILLRDDALHAPLRRPPAQVADLYQHGAAAHLINWRRAALDRLEAAGALTIDIAAEQLTAELISRYLSVKARHLL